MKEWSIGIIGAGNVVAEYHLPVLAKLAQVRVGWIYDIDRSRATRVASTFGIPGLPPDSLESAHRVEAVLVATPVGTRRALMETIVRRGWHAFCEKPFAASIADHSCMTERARGKIHVGVGLVRRFYDATAMARAFVASGVMGRPTSVLAGEGRRARKAGRGGDWYQSNAQASGGGVLSETGCHLIDQVFRVCGVEAFRMNDCAQLVKKGLELESRALASLTLPGGFVVPFTVAVSRMHDVFNGIVIRFSTGELRIGLAPDSAVELRTLDGRTTAILASGDGARTIHGAVRAEWLDFLEGIRDGVARDTGLLTTSFIEACYRFKARTLSAEVLS
jgi:predicted dehydrogenase